MKSATRPSTTFNASAVLAHYYVRNYEEEVSFIHMSAFQARGSFRNTTTARTQQHSVLDDIPIQHMVFPPFFSASLFRSSSRCLEGETAAATARKHKFSCHQKSEVNTPVCPVSAIYECVTAFDTTVKHPAPLISEGDFEENIR